MSRYSIGETFKGGYDQMSNFTGANASFKPGRFQSVRQTEGSLGSEDNYNYTSQKEIPSAEGLHLLPPPRNCKSREINKRSNYPHREMNSADTSFQQVVPRLVENGGDGFLKECVETNEESDIS